MLFAVVRADPGDVAAVVERGRTAENPARSCRQQRVQIGDDAALPDRGVFCAFHRDRADDLVRGVDGERLAQPGDFRLATARGAQIELSCAIAEDATVVRQRETRQRLFEVQDGGARARPAPDRVFAIDGFFFFVQFGDPAEHHPGFVDREDFYPRAIRFTNCAWVACPPGREEAARAQAFADLNDPDAGHIPGFVDADADRSSWFGFAFFVRDFFLEPRYHMAHSRRRIPDGAVARVFFAFAEVGDGARPPCITRGVEAVQEQIVFRFAEGHIGSFGAAVEGRQRCRGFFRPQRPRSFDGFFGLARFLFFDPQGGDQEVVVAVDRQWYAFAGVGDRHGSSDRGQPEQGQCHADTGKQRVDTRRGLRLSFCGHPARCLQTADAL